MNRCWREIYQKHGIQAHHDSTRFQSQMVDSAMQVYTQQCPCWHIMTGPGCNPRWSILPYRSTHNNAQQFLPMPLCTLMVLLAMAVAEVVTKGGWRGEGGGGWHARIELA